MNMANHPRGAELPERLRARRKELGLTLKDLAARCGLSFGFISQVERGMTMPSITSLIAMAKALDTTAMQLMGQSPQTSSTTTRQGARMPFTLGSNSASYERISTRFPGSQLNCSIITEPPGRRTEVMSHDGDEIIFILEGALTVEVAGEVFVLEEGDSLHFDSRQPHVTMNHTDRPTRMLHTCTMDYFDSEDGATP